MSQPPSPRWHSGYAPSRLDIGLAVVAAVAVLFGTVAAATVQDEARPLGAGAGALLVLAGLGLAWRRRAPVVALSVVVLLAAGYLLIGYPYGPIQLCMMFAIFEVARLRGLRTSLIACAAAAVVFVAATFSRVVVPAEVPALLLAVWVSWLALPWLVGTLVHVRSAATRRARLELAARAALEERMRVAAEVHDVAGHGFAAVAMQAGVALLVFDEQPKQARESLEAIQLTTTKALADLRTMLEAFHRRTDADRSDAHAAEGLADLAALADRVRAAGVPVRLSAEPVVVPKHIDRTAYRVIQEGLTNVLRHAGPTTAEVHLRREQDVLVVEVLDGGVGADESQPGRGLTGMRNRVSAVGGELVTETRASGGFRVCARLPVDGEPG